MTLHGLRKKDGDDHDKKSLEIKNINVTKEKEKFVSGSALKANDSEHDLKNAKRDQSFLLKFNYYELELLEEAFKLSNSRSKQEFIRSILVPEIEEKIKKSRS